MVVARVLCITCALAGISYAPVTRPSEAHNSGHVSPAGTSPHPAQLEWSSVAGGWFFTCGLSTAGRAYCWGQDALWQLGTSVALEQECPRVQSSRDACSGAPVAVSGDRTFVALSAGHEHACAIADHGDPYCWGSNQHGQLGALATERCVDRIDDIEFSCSKTPLQVAVGAPIVALAAGGDHTCGLANGGTAYCWGRNELGQLGNGSTASGDRPKAVSGGLRFTSLTAGRVHTCGISTTGVAYCWGMNSSRQLGIGESAVEVCGDEDDEWPCSTVPVPVAGGLRFDSLSAGSQHTCGIVGGGVAYCWGSAELGQLGNGGVRGPHADFGSRWRAPVEVFGGRRFTQVAAGALHTCGLTSRGFAYCWGWGDRGQIGDGTEDDQNIPVPVAGRRVFRSLAVGAHHSCGITATGAAYCWGDGTFGQLGDGNVKTFESPPVRVVDPR